VYTEKKTRFVKDVTDNSTTGMASH